MKKVFILLFPQKEYLECENIDTSLFNECIEQRYIKKGYDFFVVKFKASNLGLISLLTNKVVEADISFEQSNAISSKEWRYANFNLIANRLKINKYEKIVVGGFHCFDCVEKLANEIYKLNRNVLIDTDLTELFASVSKHQENWDIKTFKPEQKIERLFSLDDNTPPSLLKRIKTRYENPIWGIPREIINQLENKIKFQIEEKTL